MKKLSTLVVPYGPDVPYFGIRGDRPEPQLTVLGRVGNVRGDVVADIVSPKAGTVLFLTTSPAVCAGGLSLGLARRSGRITA